MKQPRLRKYDQGLLRKQEQEVTPALAGSKCPCQALQAFAPPTLNVLNMSVQAS